VNSIVKGLIDIAVRIGKWVVRRLAKWMKTHVVGYMKGKVEDFKRRKALAKTPRRIAWLAGRISRWTAAVRWLDRQSGVFFRDAAKEACKLPAFSKLPEVARCERLVGAA
jgi:hypothetical protein